MFFFCCAPLGAATFRRGQSKKKKHHPGCFFLLRPRGKAREGEAPLGAGTGPEQKKKHHPGCFFFAAAPAKGKGRRSPVGRRHGARAKKKTPPRVIFFCSGPGERQGKEKPRWAPARGQSLRGFSFPCLSPGPEQKKKTPWVVIFFFGSGPVPAPNGASPSLAFRRGRSKKKHPRWCFLFALAPCRRPTGLLLPLPFTGAAAKKKKKHPGWCFFFLLRPRADAHSLTAGLGGDASPSPGWCFFLLRPRPDRGGVFFLLWPRPDAHSLTVGWGDFGKARVVFFFLLRPRRVFLDNNKKCLGYYIGSKKTRRGHSKKKKTPLPSIGAMM